MHRIRLAARTIAALSLTLLALACNKKADSSSETGTTITPAPAAFRVTTIQLGPGIHSDKSPKSEAADFGRRDVIYAVVSTEGAAANAKLDAKWTFENGQTVNESSQVVSPAGGLARHEFHIQKATAWPTGNYTVEIMLDGVSAGTKNFVIK